jgi:homoserine dehydrogenase
MNSGSKQLSIGMLGCGVVGSQVARLLQDDEQELSERSGAVLKLSKVGVRTAGAREGVDPALITTDLQSIVSDKLYQIVEVMHL